MPLGIWKRSWEWRRVVVPCVDGMRGGKRVDRKAHTEVGRMRLPYQRRLMYVSTTVMLIVYAIAIILLVLASGGCVISSGFNDGL